MSRTRIFAAFVLTLMLVAGAMVALAGQQAGSQQTATAQGSGQQAADQTDLTFRSGINFVTVDAYVSDSKGQPIADLKQSDFEILEDELVSAMGLCGLTSMAQVTPKYVCEAETVTEAHEMSSWVNMPTPRIL